MPVMGVNEMEPVNLLLSVAPKSSSPFWVGFPEVVGTKDTPTRVAPMSPCDAKFWVTVETVAALLTVCSVKSTGPMPKIPSKPYQK